MTSTPLSPSIVTNVEFIENYIECVENLPLDIQRFVSQLREYDLLYRTKLEQIGQFLSLYRSENSSVDKRKILTKIQKCLIKSQQYGDEKLHIISQIVELVESRAQQVAKDAHSVDMDYKEELSKSINNNHRMKLDKPQKSTNNEKTTKNLYEKPKRIRRVRASDKSHEKGEKAKDIIEENEDEEMEEEDEIEATKPKKDTKKAKEKEKVVKEKVKEEKEEKKEEKKVEKNHKTSGKVTKKTSSKQITKIKKKKKKEKEVSVEDIPVDPDEPVYCVCNSISYGDMIGCDNEECRIEWFHFGCVNLTNKPKGKWFCPPCTLQRKERNKK